MKSSLKLFALLVIMGQSLNMKSQDQTSNTDSLKKVILITLLQDHPPVGKDLKLSQYNADSTQQLVFTGRFMSDTVLTGNFKLIKTNKLMGTEQTPLSKKDQIKNQQSDPKSNTNNTALRLVFYTPCTNHGTIHIKEKNPQKDCVWGSPRVL